MEYEDKYKEFEQHLASGKPEVEEHAHNWSMSIGLQDVDGLKPSEFLLVPIMNINIFYSNVFTDLRPLWLRSLK